MILFSIIFPYRAIMPVCRKRKTNGLSKIREAAMAHFLNGVRIRQTTPLKSGDMVQLGEITLRFLEPMSDKVQVTDTSPSVGFEATFMIDTDELNLKRYVQEAISSGSSRIKCGTSRKHLAGVESSSRCIDYPLSN